MEYPIGGCVILGILFLFSMQQVCISPISDRPVIFYRYIASVYCLNTWILACLLITHYQNPDDITMTKATRIFIGYVILWGSFAFVNLGRRSVDAAYKSQTEAKPKQSPLWFHRLCKTFLILHTVNLHLIIFYFFSL